MKRFDATDNKSLDSRSSATLHQYSKFKSSIRLGPNHYMAGRVGEALPSQPDRTSSTGYVRNDRDDVTSVISMARSLLFEGKLNASGH